MLVRLTECQRIKNEKYIGQIAQVNRTNVMSSDNYICYEIITPDGKRHYWAKTNLIEVDSSNLFIMLPKWQRKQRKK